MRSLGSNPCTTSLKITKWATQAKEWPTKNINKYITKKELSSICSVPWSTIKKLFRKRAVAGLAGLGKKFKRLQEVFLCIQYVWIEADRDVSGLYLHSATVYGLWISAGIFKHSMGARNPVGTGLSYRPARLGSLAELVPWNRLLGSLKLQKFGLRSV
jgi:hypothetical protein